MFNLVGPAMAGASSIQNPSGSVRIEFSRSRMGEGKSLLQWTCLAVLLIALQLRVPLRKGRCPTKRVVQVNISVSIAGEPKLCHAKCWRLLERVPT